MLARRARSVADLGDLASLACFLWIVLMLTFSIRILERPLEITNAIIRLVSKEPRPRPLSHGERGDLSADLVRNPDPSSP
jgi:hypothetical protein